MRAQHFYDVPLITAATGVWLFFGISGYVISRPFVAALVSGDPLPAMLPYALRRAARIFPLYWIALGAVIVITGTGGTRAWQLVVHFLLLNNLVPGRQAALLAAAWTLTLEVLFYIAVPVLAVALRRLTGARALDPRRLATAIFVTWAASIAFTAVADLQGDGQTGLWLRGSFPAMWQMFCPGILIALWPQLRARGWGKRLDGLGRSRLTAVSLALLIPAAVLGAVAPLRFGLAPYELLVDASRPLFAVGYGIAIAAAVRSAPWGRRGGGLLSLGLISYGIYLLHAVLLTFLLGHPGLVPLRNASPEGYAVHIAFLAALTIPLAAASWRWLETPAIALGRRYSAGPAPGRARTQLDGGPSGRTNPQ